jgi:hypothetical protein
MITYQMLWKGIKKEYQMKIKILKTILASLILATSCFANAGLMLVTSLNQQDVTPVSGNQSYTGQLGDDFTVNQDIWINSVGAFDHLGNGTFGELYWELFDVSSGNLLYSTTIAATGTRSIGSGIESNYAWLDLAQSIKLDANTVYSVAAYGFDTTDLNFNTHFTGNPLDVGYNTIGLTAPATGSARWSGAFGTLPINAGNALSTQPYHFGAANFKYTTEVPEPSTLFIFALGIMGLASRRFKK